MKLKLDISGVDFVDSELIDFYDSKTIFFEVPNFLSETVSFKIWGAELDENFNWNKYLDISKFPNIEKELRNGEKRFVIQGFSKITFEKVIAAKIEISPYDNGEFIRLKNGEIQTFKREWKVDKITDKCFEYWFGGVSIYFPYGACDLKFYTKGKVWFEFNPIDCVGFINYISNPNKEETHFGYLKNLEQLND